MEQKELERKYGKKKAKEVAQQNFQVIFFKLPVSAINEFEPRLKSAKNQFQLSAGLNLEI